MLLVLYILCTKIEKSKKIYKYHFEKLPKKITLYHVLGNGNVSILCTKTKKINTKTKNYKKIHLACNVSP